MLVGYVVGQVGLEYYQLVVIIEFIYILILLYDDVVDEFSLCCGCSIVNVLWGNVLSVLVGDFLYLCSFQLMVELDCMLVMWILVDIINCIVEGEVLQLLYVYNLDIDEVVYLCVIECKIVVLFVVGICLGVLVSGVDEVIQQVLYDYGMYLGYVFQIVDDVLDYLVNVDELGKNLGDDFVEGKVILLLIYVMVYLDVIICECLCEIVQNGDVEVMLEVLVVIYVIGGLDYSCCWVEEYVDVVECVFDVLVDNDVVVVLCGLVCYVVQCLY